MGTRCALSSEEDCLIQAVYDVAPRQAHDVIDEELSLFTGCM